VINGLTVGLALFLIGLYGLMTNKNIIKIVMANNIMANGVILLFVAIGYIPGGGIPILGGGEMVDPIPHATMLTMIVVNLSITAVGLAIAMRIYQMKGTLDVGEMT